MNNDLAKLTAEAGVKLSILEDSRAEFKGLKESVVILAEAIGHTVTAEEIEAATRRSRQQIIVGVFLTAVIVAILGTLLVYGQTIQKQGIKCVALQMFEHRVVNQQTHDRVFEQFHVPLPPHRPLPQEPTVKEINDACHIFLPDS